MTLLSLPIRRLDGAPASLAQLTGGGAILLVNVASLCDSTPQYTAMEAMHRTYVDRGLTVVGVPCNQFDAQEPGSPEQIAEFCSLTYGVTFPMTEKVNVNPPDQHPIYAALTPTPDDSGAAGDVLWNFEKFLLDGDGAVVRRFREETQPDDPAVTGAIERLLTE